MSSLVQTYASRTVPRPVVPKIALLLSVGVIVWLPLNKVHARKDQTGTNGSGNMPYAIGLWGDLPYSDLQASVGVPNLIADMNRHHLASPVHDGDLKPGNGAR